MEIFIISKIRTTVNLVKSCQPLSFAVCYVEENTDKIIIPGLSLRNNSFLSELHQLCLKKFVSS